MTPDFLPQSGKLVTLRQFRPEDLKSFQAYRHDLKLGLYQGWSPQTDEVAAHFLEEMSRAQLFVPGQWCQIGIADRATDNLIGDIGVCIQEARTEAEIGFTLCSASQGLGMGSESVSLCIRIIFEQTPVDRVFAITDSRNEPAIRMLERLSMQRIQAKGAVF